MKEHIRIRTAVLITSLIAGLSAHADPVLTISDGVTSSGPIDLTGGAGDYSTASFDGSWSVVVVAGESKPVVGSATSPELQLSIVATSLGSANPLTIMLSDTNFGPTSGANNMFAQLFGHPTSGSGDVVTFNTYIDTNDTQNALTTLLTGSGSVLPGAGDNYSSDVTNSLSLTGPYSLTEVVTIGAQAAGYSLSAGLISSNQPQPCVCTVNFNCPSNEVLCASETIPDPVAEASGIIAIDTCGKTVPVSFLGATTNGSCPTIISNTFGATSSCGLASMCSQTITVNCLPDCNVTTVPSTIVGTSGLTASVQNAGTGASYSWSIMNGTITAGQGTSSITYTAGTDTSNPVEVCVTVTSAAGCESTCCASVPVSPQPPTITLTGGDTATIGFWHNKNGQGLIDAANGGPTKTNLSFWLSSNFPCLFGSLAGQPNTAVASAFTTDFGMSGLEKTSAQVFGAALACYFTSTSLGGGAGPAGFGFNQSPGGTGSHTYNVGSDGALFGVPNNTSLTVLQLLQYVDQHYCLSGTLSQSELSAINDIFNGINQGGDI